MKEKRSNGKDKLKKIPLGEVVWSGGSEGTCKKLLERAVQKGCTCHLCTRCRVDNEQVLLKPIEDQKIICCKDDSNNPT